MADVDSVDTSKEALDGVINCLLILNLWIVIDCENEFNVCSRHVACDCTKKKKQVANK